MKSQIDIENLALLKLNEANCLFAAGFNDGAFYLGGYAIELLLKAKTCKTLGITDFFLFDKGRGEAYRPFKVHDYNQLVLLSGIYTNFQNEFKQNQVFQLHWSIVEGWNEDARYTTGKTKTNVQNFLTSVNEISIWIKKHL